jgi:hypothetical protein
MSPEQAWLADVRVDHRTDVYSLGVCLFEALAGERPFDGKSAFEVFERIKSSLPPSLCAIEQRASRDAAALVRKAMAREPGGRYADAGQLASDLRALSDGLPTQARAEQGGALRRAWSGTRLYFSGLPYEYRSRRTFLGLPLFASSPEVAIGVVAVGQRAYGVLACGGIACGALFSFGGIALGLVSSFGGLALALLAWGGVSSGYIAMGGISLAYGAYGAIGGLAIGRYAMGGAPYGKFVISDSTQTLTEEQWWAGVLEPVHWLLGSLPGA